MNQWKPREIVVHHEVEDDPVTQRILAACLDVPVVYVTSQADVRANSRILRDAGGIRQTIEAGKAVLYVAPPGKHVVDDFTIPDDRLICPHFRRLKLASNGCFYGCEWCYLKLTYRGAHPQITVYAGHDHIKKQIEKSLKGSREPVIFNSGELADSLSLEHLTHAAREFIPYFAEKENAYLYMLTKSADVDSILDLDHRGHTILTWSLNAPEVSSAYELRAPAFERRLEAIEKAQSAGYPVRVRLDPILPVSDWQHLYARAIKRIFSVISLDRITLGTLRFEEQFYHMRKTLFSPGCDLPAYVERMAPMFEPKVVSGRHRAVQGKYSFPAQERIKIFKFAITRIRQYQPNCTVALCKESADVWDACGLDLGRCKCVCQLDYADCRAPVG